MDEKQDSKSIPELYLELTESEIHLLSSSEFLEQKMKDEPKFNWDLKSSKITMTPIGAEQLMDILAKESNFAESKENEETLSRLFHHVEGQLKNLSEEDYYSEGY